MSNLLVSSGPFCPVQLRPWLPSDSKSPDQSFIGQAGEIFCARRDGWILHVTCAVVSRGFGKRYAFSLLDWSGERFIRKRLGYGILTLCVGRSIQVHNPLDFDGQTYSELLEQLILGTEYIYQ